MKYIEVILGGIFTIATTVIFVFLMIALISISPNEQAENKEQTQCNHEFVTTTEFNILSRNKYRIVSKCVKCGKIV